MFGVAFSAIPWFAPHRGVASFATLFTLVIFSCFALLCCMTYFLTKLTHLRVLWAFRLAMPFLVTLETSRM